MPRVSKKETVRESEHKKTLLIKRPSRSKKPNKSISEEVDSIQIKKVSLLELKPKKKNTKSKKTTSPDDGSLISLPKEPPLRLVNKADYLSYISHKKTPKIVAGIASFSGYSFIITGLYLTIATSDIKPQPTEHLLATTACVDSGCLESSSFTTTDTMTVDTSSTLDLSEKVVPNITFPTDFPKEPKENFIFTVDVTDITDVDLSIYSVDTGEDIVLSLKNQEGTKYSFLVPYDILKSATYNFKLKTLSVDGSKYYFTGPNFTITKTDSDFSTISTHESDLSFEFTPDSTPISTDKPHLQLENIIEGKYKFITHNATDYLRVEMYALPTFSSTPIFLGKATKKGDIWVYFLDGSLLPANTYNVFAKVVNSDTTRKTEPINISIRKTGIALTKTSASDAEIIEPLILTEKVKESLEADSSSIADNSIEQRSAYFDTEEESNETLEESINKTEDSVFDNSEHNKTTLNTEEQARKEANKLLNAVHDELNLLLQKYASSVQGNDDNIKRLALNEVNRLRDSLIIKAKTQIETKDISDKISLILTDKFTELLEEVEKYESLLRERSELIAKDTDGDGVTDFDETNLYKTDPNLPDTDGDGVIDSVEITKGFNPLSSDSEAVINFQSPKEVNYVDENNLQIESITPVVEIFDNDINKPLMAEIKGKALPNSFVTLFIFSSPTIVTVKADSDGNFVYTLEKELEEGEHEVYVAMTDNIGNIVARSKPFQFVKTAEAFTPVDAENQDVVETRDIYQETELNSYNTVAAMGVISFGLILLMLGHTLRTRPEEEIKQHDSDS
ncbi:MAG: hypothetical protein UZ19_OD1000094 [Parcubacteria bacterium OLB19]|nr:MAG: hypothetical protein UZ19_OD1000094 [Parcubacteria bacterium OLB19]